MMKVLKPDYRFVTMMLKSRMKKRLHKAAKHGYYTKPKPTQTLSEMFQETEARIRMV